MRSKAVPDDIKTKIVYEFNKTIITQKELSEKYNYCLGTIQNIIRDARNKTPNPKSIPKQNGGNIEIIDLEQQQEFKDYQSFLKQNNLL